MKYSMKTSIIILTYNELQEGTIPCVESIYEHTNINDFDLIIVDNASKDATPKYLQGLKEKYHNVKIQLNSKKKDGRILFSLFLLCRILATRNTQKTKDFPRG